MRKQAEPPSRLLGELALFGAEHRVGGPMGRSFLLGAVVGGLGRVTRVSRPSRPTLAGGMTPETLPTVSASSLAGYTRFTRTIPMSR